MSYTSENLLLSIKLRGQLPDTTNNLNPHSDSNILKSATEVLHTMVMPLIMSAREQFYVTEQQIALVPGTNRYEIPSRAAGQVVRDVYLLSNGEMTRIPQIAPEDAYVPIQSEPQGWYLEHNDVMIYPTPNRADTLVIKYFLRPSQIVRVSEAALVTAKNSNTLSVVSVPSAFASSAGIYDIISPKSPYEPINFDVSGSISGTDISFTSDINAAIGSGFYIALADQTPIPQIPREFMPLLITGTAAMVTQDLGDLQQSMNLHGLFQKQSENLLSLIVPRNQGDTQKITNSTWTAWGQEGF